MNLAEIQPDMGIIRDIPLHSVLEPNRSRFFEFCKPLADGNIFSARSEDDVQFWIMQYQPPRSSILGLANHIQNLADPNSEFNEHWDVEINVTSSSGETKIFRGHKALLARYDYFQAMLSSNFSEGISGRVEINDTSPAAFQVLWDSFYCKPTTASIQKLNCLEVLDAMELSVRFGVNNLRAALSDQLISMSFMTMSAPMLPAMLKACSTFELRKLEMVFSIFTLKSSKYRPTRSHKILFPILTFLLTTNTGVDAVLQGKCDGYHAMPGRCQPEQWLRLRSPALHRNLRILPGSQAEATILVWQLKAQIAH